MLLLLLLHSVKKNPNLSNTFVLFNFPTETWEMRETKVQREGGGEEKRGPRGEGYGKGSKGDNDNKNVDPGKMRSTEPIQLNRKELRNNNYLSIYGLPFFLISLKWHNSQVFFTSCLNHVNRYDACMCFTEPEL